jgi:hypothetical protein
MSKGFRERILEVFENGTALANSTTQTSLLPATAKGAYVEAGSLEVGSVIAFMFSGRISNIVTTPGTLALALRLGSVDVFASGAMALNVVAKTDVHWMLEGELVVRAIGLSTSTTLFPKGCRWTSHSVIGAAAPTAGGAESHLLPFNAAPAVGSGFDFSASQLIDLMATWSVANAGNSIQLHAGHVDVYSRT